MPFGTRAEPDESHKFVGELGRAVLFHAWCRSRSTSAECM